MDAEVFTLATDGSGAFFNVTDNVGFAADADGPFFARSDGAPSWSLDSSRIAFQSDTDKFFNIDIYVINADGTGRTQLTTAGGIQWNPSYGPPADPAAANDCKQGGWQDFGFRNQGQCIRFVNTGMDSRE